MKRAVLGILAFFVLLFSMSVRGFADLLNVEGQLQYYDENGRPASGLGVDLSYYNNQVDFKALKDQGFSFVLIRLGGRGWGTGGLYGDRLTQTYLLGAREAGLKIGAYFYSSARNAAEALEEAEASLRTLNGFPLDLPVFIDMEISGSYPGGRADSLSPGERADVIDTYCQAIEAAGYESGLYASEGYVRFHLDLDAVRYLPLWLASYTVDNRLPQYIHDYAFWQQTDSAFAGGIDGPFDLNIVF